MASAAPLAPRDLAHDVAYGIDWPARAAGQSAMGGYSSAKHAVEKPRSRAGGHEDRAGFRSALQPAGLAAISAPVHSLDQRARAGFDRRHWRFDHRRISL